MNISFAHSTIFLSYKRSKVLLFLWFHKEKKIIVKTKETSGLDANMWILCLRDSCIAFSWLTLCRPKRRHPQTHIRGPPVCVCVCVCVCVPIMCAHAHSVAFNSFATPWTVAHRLLCPLNSPGKNTGAGSHFPLQRIFPTEGSNPSLLNGRQNLYHWATRET